MEQTLLKGERLDRETLRKHNDPLFLMLGDSRAYLFKDQDPKLLNCDYSFITALIALGEFDSIWDARGNNDQRISHKISELAKQHPDTQVLSDTLLSEALAQDTIDNATAYIVQRQLYTKDESFSFHELRLSAFVILARQEKATRH